VEGVAHQGHSQGEEVTASTDETALLATIAANPEDDTSRLVYADWLDENADARVPCPTCNGKGESAYVIGAFGPFPNGCPRCDSGTVPADTSRQERAEFVRVQCEIARFTPADWQWQYNAGTLPPEHPVAKRFTGRGLTGEMVRALRGYNGKLDALRARESAILSRRRVEWSPKCLHCINGYMRRPPRDLASDRCELCSARAAHCTFARGFPFAVKVPTIASGWANTRVMGGHPESYYEWQPTPAAVAMLAAYPTVRQVVPVDRVPHDNGDDVMWCRNFPNQQGTDHWGLPAVVFNALRWARVEDRGAPYRKSYFYPTPDAALSALGAALRDLIWDGVM
jgi:uncharacterized protein (TIGR02996 family)